MPLKRVVVYVDADDLATIEKAAENTQVSKPDIIRDAIHLAAMRMRRRSEPLRLRRFAGGDPTLTDRVDEILAEDSTQRTPLAPE
ncbi:ribbon-helix-helix protein, CopG family [Nocardia sp. bgisy118]|uniref:ribbon-helix-helix protein, CopG family n=1 Tax=Nocardia sp. bgisy118 TaxID=3413786 RepID=UPI003F4A7A35